MTYARGTTVSVEHTRADVERLLAKHGATKRMVFADDEKSTASIGFAIRGAHYRIDLPLPERKKFRDGKRHEQACRERWRLVLLALKSKLELVSLGGSTIEREFMADLVLENGRTLHQELPELIRRGLVGDAPPMLPPGS
jgi:hypothetical protein